LPNCGFKVSGECRPWEEGKLLVFLDANVHEAFNNSNERRYILLLDILRPEFENKKKAVCVKILAMLSLYYALSLHPSFMRVAKKVFSTNN
jgi:aspartyl/asparaginyl beta-hydroxylase (cupin superfamily)